MKTELFGFNTVCCSSSLPHQVTSWLPSILQRRQGDCHEAHKPLLYPVGNGQPAVCTLTCPGQMTRTSQKGINQGDS